MAAATVLQEMFVSSGSLGTPRTRISLNKNIREKHTGLSNEVPATLALMPHFKGDCTPGQCRQSMPAWSNVATVIRVVSTVHQIARQYKKKMPRQ
eukprot:g31354.t1